MQIAVSKRNFTNIGCIIRQFLKVGTRLTALLKRSSIFNKKSHQVSASSIQWTGVGIQSVQTYENIHKKTVSFWKIRINNSLLQFMHVKYQLHTPVTVEYCLTLAHCNVLNKTTNNIQQNTCICCNTLSH